MFQKRIIFSTTLLGLFLFLTPAGGGMPPVLKQRIGIPPFKVIREVLATNDAKDKGKKDLQVRQGETPYLTWLADSDLRLSSASILPGGGRMISVHNPGGQLAISPGTLNYGIYQLRTPVLLITGIADSRHINYYLKGYNQLSRSLRMDLDHLHPALQKEAAIDHERENPAEKLLRLVETNVDYQVRQALKNYEERVTDGRLVVIGSVFDTINHYGRGQNKLIIVNVNGKKGKALKAMGLIRQIQANLRQYVKGE